MFCKYLMFSDDIAVLAESKKDLEEKWFGYCKMYIAREKEENKK